MEKLPLLEYGEVEWRVVPGFGGRYTVSSDGRIFSLEGMRLKRPFVNNMGYRQVDICHNGKRHKPYVHRLVAMAFLGPPSNETQEINHIDGNRSNNCLKNLEWCSRSENIAHRYRTGLCSTERSKNGKRFLDASDVEKISGLIDRGAKFFVWCHRRHVDDDEAIDVKKLARMLGVEHRLAREVIGQIKSGSFPNGVTECPENTSQIKVSAERSLTLYFEE